MPRMAAPTQPKLQELNARHALPNLLRFEAGEGGLTRAVITTPHADAEVYLHGAHVTRFAPRGSAHPVLWMSAHSLYTADKPIRGGVPLVFPWFGPKAGDAAAPLHGFARTKPWQVESTAIAPDGTVELALTLRDDEQTRAAWPHAFVARLLVRVGPALGVTLRVENPGDAPFTFEEALHTYFAVGDVRRASISGLEGTAYIDKVENFAEKRQGDVPVTLSGETDRIYLNTRAACTIRDPTWNRQITVAKENSTATVVWNPWAEKAKAMADFGDDEWPGTVCVETCNVRDGKITLGPGQSHEMRAVIRG